MIMAVGGGRLKSGRKRGLFAAMGCPEETVIADEGEFEGKLGNTAGLLLVKFWDGAPHTAQGALSFAAKRHSARIKFISLVTKDHGLRKKYAIRHSPTFVLFKDGKERARISGPSLPIALDVWCEVNSI